MSHEKVEKMSGIGWFNLVGILLKLVGELWGKIVDMNQYFHTLFYTFLTHVFYRPLFWTTFPWFATYLLHMVHVMKHQMCEKCEEILG
jgi:hypothetical protein